MKIKILSIFGIIISSALFVWIIYLKSVRSDQKIMPLQQRVYTSLKAIDTIYLDDTYSKIRFHNDSLFFVSYKKENQGILFRYDVKTKSTVKQTYNYSMKSEIIDAYKVIENKDSTFYYFYTSSDNFVRRIHDNKIILHKEAPVLIFRIHFSNKEKALIATRDSVFNALYYDYNFQKNTIEKIEVDDDLYNGIEYPGLTLDGNMVSNDDYIFLTPMSQSKVLIFNKDLKYEDYFDLIYKSPKFSLIQKSDGELISNPKNKFPNISTDVTNSHYYVLNSEFGEPGKKGDFFIDRYNLSVKDYEKSFKLEMKKGGFIPKEIKINDNKLYILNNRKQIIIYDCENKF